MKKTISIAAIDARDFQNKGKKPQPITVNFKILLTMNQWKSQNSKDYTMIDFQEKIEKN